MSDDGYSSQTEPTGSFEIRTPSGKPVSATSPPPSPTPAPAPQDSALQNSVPQTTAHPLPEQSQDIALTNGSYHHNDSNDSEPIETTSPAISDQTPQPVQPIPATKEESHNNTSPTSKEESHNNTSPTSPPPELESSSNTHASGTLQYPDQNTGEVLEHQDTSPAQPPSIPEEEDATTLSQEESLFPSEIGKGESLDESEKPKLRLGDRLIEAGLISKDQVDIALQEQRRSSEKKMIGAILVDMNFITESALAEFLAESAGTERFDPRNTMIDPQVISMIPKEVAIRNKVIPISLENNNLQLAMADIYNVVAIDQIRRHVPKNCNIIPMYSTDSEIQELIDQYYAYEISIEGILKEIETGIQEKNIEEVLDGSQDNYVSPTVRLVNALLIDAIKMGASDIHFEPEGTFLRLRYRIDGQMMQIRSFHSDYWPAIVVRIKIMSGMNIAESRMPQDGRIAFTILGREVDFRVATQPTVYGENIVMRLLDKKKSLVPLDKLGFSNHNITLLKRLLKRPEGIIIVTGPTGSGKTTTLYSVLSYINDINVNIMTLEDPVEYQLPLIRQTNVKEGTIDFLSGIKSLMRQDPDIIFIGEVRDEETALMAVRASMTGHQVFTTLHTNDALGAIPRLNDIGVPLHLLAGSLICCMAQRLARKLCSNCKEQYVATPEECKILGVPPDDPPTLYRPKGCEQCMSGYKGRTAIIEILRVDDELDELIASGASRMQMMEYAINNGFIPMPEDGIQKVLQGDIDLEELIRRIDMTDRL